MEIAGAIVGATVRVGLQNVLTSIQEVISMARHYEEYLEDLKISLEMVQGFLSDVDAKKVGREALVKIWLNQLEDLAFEADAVLDAVKYKLLQRQVENQNNPVSKMVLGSLTSVPSKCCLKVTMSGKIKDILNKFNKINKRAEKFGLRNAVAATSQTSTVRGPNERETNSFSIEPCVEGRDADVDKIIEMLITAPQKDKIYVLPISGMGGVGKTTVAGTVFKHAKTKNHFGERIWLSVSLNFDAISIFNMILQDLTKEAVTVTSKEVVLQKIQKILMNEENNPEKNKPYLLILDDVWNEENDKWDDEFMVPLSQISNNLSNGNCIVVTTRKKNVASLVKTLHTHQLNCLSETQCWSIIKAKAFGGEYVPEEFEKIGIDIAKRCYGLPLAAKVLGGLMRRKSEEYWRSILKLEFFGGIDENIMKILRLSYDNLPTLSLKKCFAYCSIFPKGYTIRKKEMIKLWMAEGFLQVGQWDDMEMAGNEVFNRFLQYSLFQDEKRNKFGDIVDCKMHDLVHDLACSITKDMNQVRYLSLKCAKSNEPNAISQMKYLRTLFFEGKLACNMFSNFRYLHVLKLTGLKIKKLPCGIEKLIHLRSLDISSTHIKRLPDSIGKLYHLQTLLISQRSMPESTMKKLPNTLTNLVGLRHLHISAKTKLPPLIGKLTSLRTLKHYKVRDTNGCGIRELGSLKNLKGTLKIENLEIVKDKEEAEFADLSGKPDIFRLILEWNGVGDHKDVLDGLRPHQGLKSLEIIGYEGITLPSWTKSMATLVSNIEIKTFNCLGWIKLEGFTQCKELPTLGHLQHLRALILADWLDLESIGFSFYRIENLIVPEVVFPALELLEMRRIPKLTKWLEMNEATTVFPCLKGLWIKDCPRLMSVPSHFPCLKLLEVVVAYLSFKNLFSNNTSLLKNQNLTNLHIVPASLKRLTIYGCENLIELPDGLNTLCKLEELWIRNCKGLKLIPIGLLESCISSLETLCLGKLENLENLDTLIPCLGKMLRLKNLIIMEILKFNMIPTKIGCLRSLRALGIGGFSEPMNVDQLTTILQKCPSLEILYLYGKEPHYDTLIEMDSVKHLSLHQVPELHTITTKTVHLATV